MFSPPYFKQIQIEPIIELINNAPLATLISAQNNELQITHLPLKYYSDENNGYLLGHVAKANNHWQLSKQQPKVTLIFQGPNTYISPTWYETPDVPTWNYSVVHIQGSIELIHDEETLIQILDELTVEHENKLNSSWLPDWEDKRTRVMLKAIVGLKISIETIEAKFKLSQNRSLNDRRSVIAHLQSTQSSGTISIADLMQGTL